MILSIIYLFIYLFIYQSASVSGLFISLLQFRASRCSTVEHLCRSLQRHLGPILVLGTTKCLRLFQISPRPRSFRRVSSRWFPAAKASTPPPPSSRSQKSKQPQLGYNSPATSPNTTRTRRQYGPSSNTIRMRYCGSQWENIPGSLRTSRRRSW